MEEVIEKIEHMEHEDLSRAAWALMQRWNRLHPTEELAILTLPKNDPSRREHILTTLRAMLMKYEQGGEAPD